MKKYFVLLLSSILLVTPPMAFNIAKAATEKKLTVQSNVPLNNIGASRTIYVKEGSAKLSNKKLVFSSDDPLVANVDVNGKITAQGGGKATIRIKLKANSKLSSKCIVTVKKPSPITISLIAESNIITDKDNLLYKAIKDKLGVSFKINYYTGDSEQKNRVMIASGEYPDIICSDQKFIDAGGEIPLEGLIEKYAPNIKRHIEPYYKMLKDPKKKHIYYLVNYGRIYGKKNITSISGTGFFIQKAVLKEFGYPKIKTIAQYIDLLKKYKAKHPIIDGKPTIAYEIGSNDSLAFGLINPPQFLAGYPNDGNVIVNPKTYKAQIFADKDIMKRWVKILNNMFADGLIAPETFLSNNEQYLTALSTGNVLGFNDQEWNISNVNYSLYAQGKIERQYVGLPLVFDNGIKQRYITAPELNLGSGWSISKSCKNPIRVIKFFDSLMTEDWQKIIQWGEKGKDYLVDSKGMFYRTDEMRKEQENAAVGKVNNATQTFWEDCPKIEGHYSDGNPSSPQNSLTEFRATLNQYDKKFLDGYGYKCWADFFGPVPPKNPIYYPCWNISLGTKSPASIAITQIKNLEIQQLPKIIMAKPNQFEAMWKAYVSMFKYINVKAYEKAINDGIQWRLKNWL